MASRTRWGLIGLGCAAVLAPDVIDAASRAVATREVRHALDSVSGLSVDTVALGRDRRAVLLGGVRLQTPQGVVTIGRATLQPPSGSDGGLIDSASAASASVALDDIRLTFGNTAVLVPHAEASGSPLSAIDFAALFDQTRPDALLDRLPKLTAAEIRAPAVMVSNHVGDNSNDDPTLTFHDVILSDVAEGRIAALSVKDMTSSGGKPEAGLSFSIGAMKAAHLDVPTILRIVEGSRSDLAEPVRPLLTALSIDAFVLKSNDGDMRLGSFQLGEIRGRPPLTAFADMNRITEKPVAERNPAEIQRFADSAVDILKSFAADRIEADDLTFRSDKDSVSLGLGAAIVEGLEPGRLKLFALERMALSSVPADMMLGRVAVEGYDQSRLVEAVAKEAGATSPGEMSTQFGRLAPTFGTASLRSMRIDAQADDLKGNARQGRRNVIDVPTADLTLRRAAATGTSAVAHMQVIYDIAADAPDAGLHQLVDVGFPHLDVSLDYRSTWSEASRTLSFDQIAFAAQGMGSVGLSTTVGNVAPELFDAPGTETATALAQDVEVRAVRLDLVNAGIADKLWSMAAERAGISVPLLKAEAKGQVEAAVLQTFGNTPAATRVSAAIATFIDQPKTLMISVKAPPGLSVRTVTESGGDRALLDRLEIDAAAGR